MNDSVSETMAGSKKKIFFGWWVVVATILGVALGYSVVAVMSFGTFITSLETEFGWSRAQLSAGPTVIGITAIIFFPMAGMLVDKYGARKILLPSIISFALAIASMYYLTNSLWHLYAMCVLIPLLGAGTAPLTYSRILVAWFNKKRGLALGIGLAGVGLGTTLVPVIASYFIENYGWRIAYLVLGSLILLISFPSAKLLLRESPKDLGLLPDGIDEKEEGTETENFTNNSVGYTASQALRQKTFWLMFFTFLVAGTVTSTVLVHLIPMMMDRGQSQSEAAATFAYLGISIILGRLAAGYLMDKFFAPYVVILFLLCPAFGLAMLADGGTGTLAAVSAGLIGAAIGAEFDVMGYFTSRYFGPRAFGQIYGYNYSGFKIGASVGPLAMGVGYDIVGTYDPILWFMSGFTIFACILVGLLGPYPKLPASQEGKL